jgi:tRNA (5-methylaminomethyl-2-thiouridylate)-methyltransferase
MHFEDHLSAPRGLGALRDWPHSGAAGGAACGDLIRVAVRLDGDRIAEAGFDAEGCGAARAAGSAAVELVEGEPLIRAASVGPDEISQALGGLIPAKRHAAELAADALHRALGAAAPQARLSPNPRRTLVAMSGGVDSAAAAQLGITPNPCVRCNGFVRFDAMLELAEALGAGRLATGHYARIARDEHGPLIRAAADPRKDQSYMLAKLDPAQLDRLSFPLGGLTKDAVRALARDAGLPVADKRESQDLCFVAGLGGRAFLQRHGGPRLRRPGEIVDASGAVLGRHDGQHGFTVGQRRGLQLDGAREPLYVLAKDADTNRVTVGPREALATTTVRLSQTTLHRPAGEVRQVRLRYHARPLTCEARRIDDATIELRLAEPAEAVAPGQQACLMREDCVVGEGTIA